MKKVFAVLLGLFIFSTSIFAGGFDKAVGVDFSFSGIVPNFYMVGSHFELESGITYTQNTILSSRNTITPSILVGYSADFGKTDARFAIGLSDSFMVGFSQENFNTGNLLSIYLRLSKPLDSRMELSGIMFVPLHYINISTQASEYVNMLPCWELLSYGFSMFTFEIRYYLGGL